MYHVSNAGSLPYVEADASSIHVQREDYTTVYVLHGLSERHGCVASEASNLETLARS